MHRLSSLLVVIISLLLVAEGQVTHTPHSASEAEEALHQIPPPNRHPSEHEIREAISQLLDEEVDTDQDGVYTMEELKKALDRNHQKLINENLDRQWNYYKPEIQEVHSWEGYEPTKTKVLHWDQYKELTYPEELMKEDPENPHFKSMSIMYKRSEKRYALADKNSDTVLTKDEFKDFIYPEESATIRDVLVDEAMDDMDVNKDGSISLDEYMTHLSDMTDPADRAEGGWEQVKSDLFKVSKLTNVLFCPFFSPSKTSSRSTSTRTRTAALIKTKSVTG